MNTHTDKLLPFGIDPNHNYTTKEAAEEVRCKPCALESQRCNGTGPRFVKAGRRVLYPGSFLIEYLESRTVSNTQRFGRCGDV
jgi:hypothetical protein